MNWDALGAIGEIIGAIAVVITLGFLAIQIRYSTRSMDESNRLQRATAIDRHADSVNRWRGSLSENEDLARIWLAAIHDEELSDIDHIRFNNLWIVFNNTQRSNYERAILVGERGLADQYAKSIAAESLGSEMVHKAWLVGGPWMALASLEFVSHIEKEMQNMEKSGAGLYRSGSMAATASDS